jgi:hypothetical protein
MKYLVHLSFPYYTYHSLIILNEAQRLIDEKNEVDILTCGGGVKKCYGNVTADSSMCKICIKMQRRWLKMLSGRKRIFTYKDFLLSGGPQKFEYQNPDDIKGILYKGVKIGYGAYSSYVSITKNLHPKMDASFRTFFDDLLAVQCTVTDLLENYLRREKPDAVLMFSARHFEVRPFYDLPFHHNVGVECLEAGFSLTKDEYRGFNYGKFQPHSIEFHHSFLLKQWEQSIDEPDRKEAVGKEFFERKRANVSAGGLVYTAAQQAGMLPENWDHTKRNIVIFNSSEDEFVAVGDEYARKAMFSDQFVGINEILNLVRHHKDLHIYVRVHPAQKNVQYKYHQELYQLPSKYPNVTVIHAADKVSSYTLIEHAEKIIVFGSTIGIEAAYWNKPVILLAGALYYYLNDVYVPKDRSELKQMLLATLPSRKSQDTVKFGYYMMTERGYKLDKIGLKRKNLMVVKLMKINRESLFDMVVRFVRLRKFQQLEIQNSVDIPAIEL